MVDQASYARPARLVPEFIVAGAQRIGLSTALLRCTACRSSWSAGIAALVTAATALILRGNRDDGEGQAEERDLSVAAVLLGTIAAAAAAAGMAATGAIILATHGW